MSAALISRTVLMAVIAAVATGCATKKDFYATGGSRADGTVDMAYDFRPFETPVVSQQQAQSIAKSKCAVWGYRDAESFGGMTQNCYRRNEFGTCTAGQNIIKYQCIGNLDAPPSVSAVPAGDADLLGSGRMRRLPDPVSARVARALTQLIK